MKALLSIIFMILMSYILNGQDLTGKWTGKIEIKGSLVTLVFHVHKTGDQYAVTLDSPDQNAFGIKAAITHFKYPEVRFEVASLGVVYEAILSDQSMTGKWVQQGTALFLTLRAGEETH